MTSGADSPIVETSLDDATVAEALLSSLPATKRTTPIPIEIMKIKTKTVIKTAGILVPPCFF